MVNITDTVLASALVPALRKSIEELQCKIEDDFVAQLRRDPVHALEWRADDAFKLAAEMHIKRCIADEYERMLKTHEDDTPLRVTMENVYNVVRSVIKHKRALACSTSPCSNLMEQHIVQMGMDIADGSYSSRLEFRNAQRNDPEVVAAFNRELEELRAYQAMYDEAVAENRRFDRRAARRARKEA